MPVFYAQPAVNMRSSWCGAAQEAVGESACEVGGVG